MTRIVLHACSEESWSSLAPSDVRVDFREFLGAPPRPIPPPPPPRGPQGLGFREAFTFVSLLAGGSAVQACVSALLQATRAMPAPAAIHLRNAGNEDACAVLSMMVNASFYASGVALCSCDAERNRVAEEPADIPLLMPPPAPLGLGLGWGSMPFPDCLRVRIDESVDIAQHGEATDLAALRAPESIARIWREQEAFAAEAGAHADTETEADTVEKVLALAHKKGKGEGKRKRFGKRRK